MAGILLLGGKFNCYFIHAVLIKLKMGHEANYRDDDNQIEETQVLLSTQDYSLDENRA